MKLISHSSSSRLQTRIGLILGALILLLAVILALFLSDTAQSKILHLGTLNLEALADQVGRELSDGMDGFARGIETQSDRDVFRAAVPNHDEMRAALDNFKRLNPQFAFICIIDAKTAKVLAATDGVYEGGDLRDRPVYFEGMKGPYLGDVHNAVRLAELLPKPTNGEPRRFLDVAVPIRDDRGNIVRILASHIGFEWTKEVVDKVIAPIRSSQDTELFLVDTADKVVLSDDPTVPVGTDLGMLLGNALRANQTKPVDWLGQGEYLTSSVSVLPRGRFQGFGWRVVARQSYASALAPVRDMKLAFLVGAIVLGLFAAITAWLVAGWIVRPVRRLAEAADRADIDAVFESLQSGHNLGEVTAVHRALSRFADAAREGNQASLLSGQQFKALAESLREVVWQADAKGRVEYISQAWARQGSGADALMVADFAGLLIEEDRAAFVRGWQRSAAQVTELSIRGRLQNTALGQRRWSELNARPVRGQDGMASRWVGTIIDIHDVVTATERAESALSDERAARAAAEQLAKTRDEFLAVASHELRAPLSAIMGWADILSKHEFNDSTVSKAAEVIRRNAQVQTAIVNDLLDMSAVLTGKLPLLVQPTNVSQILTEILISQQPAAHAKSISLIGVPHHSAMVSADRRRIAQMFSNIVANAIKFTQVGGRVELSLSEDEHQVMITVSDDGPGIAADFLPFVFDRMRQEDASSTRPAGGLGLGLAIARGIAELHHGSIDAASPGKGHGSSFVVRLPALPAGADLPQSARTLRDEDAMPAALPAMHVLVVDDEFDAREVAEASLRCLGASVRLASSGAEALRMLHLEHFDLLMTDIGMPDMDGLTLVREIRKLPGFTPRHLPVVALTGFTLASDRAKGFAAGVQSYVAKPISLRSLAEGLTEAVKVTL